MSNKTDKFLTDHLIMWKESGVPAPLNELQSIAAWLRASADKTKEELQTIMRTRMILLMKASQELFEEGMEAEDIAGIYNNRPDLKADRDANREEA